MFLERHRYLAFIKKTLDVLCTVSYTFPCNSSRHIWYLWKLCDLDLNSKSSFVWYQRIVGMQRAFLMFGVEEVKVGIRRGQATTPVSINFNFRYTWTCLCVFL